jgi:hypothetical protein
MKKTKKWVMTFLLGVVLTFGATLAGCNVEEALAPPVPADGGITYTLDQVGGQSGSVTTSAIRLTFADDVSGLSANDIHVEGAVTPGGLSGGPKVWNLALAEVAEQGEATLRVSKDGIVKTAKQVQVYKGEYMLQNVSSSATDLKIRFGITATGTEGVTATFYALHSLIATPTGNDNFTAIIKPGDWIDLPFLQVAGYPVDGNINGNGKIEIESNTTWDGNHGELLRLIVVGINSFNNKNDNGATPHVVFQFQNIPGFRCMEATNTNQNGYLNSEMRAYLVNNFLPGLINSGVPDAFLWAPSRCVANKGEGADAADIIPDKLWLPTVWEMFGANHSSNATHETTTNQASFTGFYNGTSVRTKYNTSAAVHYWLASPYSSSTDGFCIVNTYGAATFTSAVSVIGVAPAFCVR